eukprot:CAMPEP_0174366710 /NCGR_PEP_ID=MMETSP0811_2-20130205/82255_1 /TAXON_ID=73025 ORGANISM="Eutreptiella gymnastica-like, Strain CCMP1594" /NCGR_SAMPLE_ID=MMETSP0811_2 /ASSEMBLY_ACC=CAM_ASM_000667 /LENGTH=72 /DNA_ID=CAMNT_0015508529 /DNA_START=26 /DNA_END=241 /DNA_ORIENTATION=+
MLPHLLLMMLVGFASTEDFVWTEDRFITAPNCYWADSSLTVLEHNQWHEQYRANEICRARCNDRADCKFYGV